MPAEKPPRKYDSIPLPKPIGARLRKGARKDRRILAAYAGLVVEAGLKTMEVSK